METYLSVILFTFIIALISFLPIPGMPVLFISYKVNGLTGGFISAYFGGSISSIIQYFLAKNFFLKLVNRFNKNKFTKKLVKYSKKIKNLTYFELILFMLSSIPSILKIPACGVAKIKFRKFIICFLGTSIPFQLIIVLSFLPAQTLDNKLTEFGINQIHSFILSLGTYSLILFILLLSIKKLRLWK